MSHSCVSRTTYYSLDIARSSRQKLQRYYDFYALVVALRMRQQIELSNVYGILLRRTLPLRRQCQFYLDRGLQINQSKIYYV